MMKKIGFYHHLISVDEKARAGLWLGSLLEEKPAPSVADSLWFLAGYYHYEQKELEASFVCFRTVSESSPLFPRSVLMGTIDLLHLGRLGEARAWLNEIPDQSPDLEGLIRLQKAGLALLNRDMVDFDSLSVGFSGRHFAYAGEEEKLRGHAQAMKDYRPRSPLLAAGFSAILPGSGKVYAGKTGEGIASFLTVAALSLITFENIRRDGWLDLKSIFFGGMTTVYYGGNIWGSYFTATEANKRFYHALDQHILFDLHIPVRAFFP